MQLPDKKYCGIVFIIIVLLFKLNISHARTEIGEISEFLINADFSKLKECAESNDRICVRNLGIFYAYKFKLPDGKLSQDIALAKVWLEKATFYPSARLVLGLLYTMDENKAKTGESLIFSACTESNISACEQLYNIYTTNSVKNIDCDNRKCDKFVYAVRTMIKLVQKDKFLGDEFKKGYVSRYNVELAKILIRRNDPKAINILEKEVSNDTPFATIFLAQVYADGKLTPRNLTRAYMMYDLTGTGYADEKAKVAAQMTPEQIHEAQEMSWRWQDEHRSYRAGYRGSDMGIQWKLEQH